jgi:hypothetical protein
MKYVYTILTLAYKLICMVAVAGLVHEVARYNSVHKFPV